MRSAGNVVIFGLGGLAVGAALVESKSRQQIGELASQLAAARHMVNSVQSELSREREMRQAAERSVDEKQRSIAEANKGLAARDAEIARLKAEQSTSLTDRHEVSRHAPKNA